MVVLRLQHPTPREGMGNLIYHADGSHGLAIEFEGQWGPQEAWNEKVLELSFQDF